MPFVLVAKNNLNLSTFYIKLWIVVIYYVETYIYGVCMCVFIINCTHAYAWDSKLVYNKSRRKPNVLKHKVN